MVALNFNMLGFSYQQGIGYLEDGFVTSTAALAERRAQLDRDLQAYEALVEAGGERIGEWEDGHRVWEQDQLIGLRIDDAEESVMDLRKAYVLALYHHWERAARRWTRISVWSSHDKLAAATRGLGYPIDRRLEAVRDLVNTLKHNSAERATQLFASWPDVLKANPAERPGLDWYSMVSLDDRHVREACEIVRRSGPDGDLLPLSKEPA